MTFNHENLKVYQRTLAFNSKVGARTEQWDRKHAVCDQLSRTAEYDAGSGVDKARDNACDKEE